MALCRPPWRIFRLTVFFFFPVLGGAKWAILAIRARAAKFGAVQVPSVCNLIHQATSPPRSNRNLRAAVNAAASPSKCKGPSF